MGIIGLFVVVAHRQKRKKQLKALLRAKNLGPLLESKQIAQNTGMKYYPQYVQKKQPRDGSRRGGTSPPTPDIDGPDMEVGDHKKWKKLDINDLLGLCFHLLPNSHNWYFSSLGVIDETFPFSVFKLRSSYY